LMGQRADTPRLDTSSDSAMFEARAEDLPGRASSTFEEQRWFRCRRSACRCASRIPTAKYYRWSPARGVWIIFVIFFFFSGRRPLEGAAESGRDDERFRRPHRSRFEVCRGCANVDSFIPTPVARLAPGIEAAYEPVLTNASEARWHQHEITREAQIGERVPRKGRLRGRRAESPAIAARTSVVREPWRPNVGC